MTRSRWDTGLTGGRPAAAPRTENRTENRAENRAKPPGSRPRPGLGLELGLGQESQARPGGRWHSLGRLGRRGATLAVILCLFAAAAVAGVNAFDHRESLITLFAARTGRTLIIGGRVWLTLSPWPTVILDDVTVTNPAWAGAGALIHARRVRVVAGLAALWHGRPELARVTLEHAEIWLERRPGRGVTWSLESGPGGGEPLAINRLVISDTTVRYIDGGRGSDHQLTLESGWLALPAGQPLRFDVEGRFRDTPFTLSGEGADSGGRFADLFADAPVWPFGFLWRGAGAAVRGRGRIERPLTTQALDLSIGVVGHNLQALGPILGLGHSPPATHRYEARFRLTGNLDHLIANDLEARLADSDLSGRLALELSQQRPRVTGRLHSRTLRVDDLTRASLTPPPPAPEDGRVISDRRLPLATLGAVDARLTVTADRLVTWPMDTFAVTADLVLTDGRLTVSQVQATLAEGRLALEIEAGAGDSGSLLPQPWLRSRGQGHALRLERLLTALGVRHPPSGPLEFTFDLTGAGTSLRTLFASATGRVAILTGQGTLPVRGFDLIAADLLQAILPWTSHGESTPLECMAARFTVSDGLAQADELLIDTSRVTLSGGGTLDLDAEQIDLLLHPRPKDPSLISLATPVRVTGRFAAPHAAPDALGLATKGAAGLLLGLVSPVAALLPFINPGTGSAHPCHAMAIPNLPPGPGGLLVRGARRLGAWLGVESDSGD